MNPQSAVKIRQADVSDAIEFLRLEAKCFGMRFSLNTLYYWRPIIDYCWAFKAVYGRRIVGGAIAIPTRDGRIYVNSLFVHPRIRKCGIGTRLLSKVLELQPHSGFILDVTEEKAFLRRFYRQNGFEEARKEENYYLDRSTRIIMVRRKNRAG